jgi:hypothetical protein
VHGIKKGMVGFGSVPPRMAIRGGLEGEDVRKDRGCGEGNAELVLDVGQVLNSRTCIASFAAGTMGVHG